MVELKVDLSFYCSNCNKGICSETTITGKDVHNSCPYCQEKSEKTISSLEDTIEKLEETISSLEARIEALECENQKLIEENDKLEDSSEFSIEFKALEEENSTLKAKVEQLES